MQRIDVCSIRRMESDDLARVLRWRNHPEIRRHMLTQHEITMAEHRSWFGRASTDATRKILIVEQSGIAIGFVQFSGVMSCGIVDWGFYAAPEAPKGAGKALGITALNFAFQTLRLHKVCGQALTVNETSIHFHRSLGFQEEGVLREQRRIAGKYYDLVCFGLLSSDWPVRESQ